MQCIHFHPTGYKVYDPHFVVLLVVVVVIIIAVQIDMKREYEIAISCDKFQ